MSWPTFQALLGGLSSEARTVNAMHNDPQAPEMTEDDPEMAAAAFARFMGGGR